MTDTKANDAPSNDGAEEEQTDEQVWAEIEAEKVKGRQPDTDTDDDDDKPLEGEEVEGLDDADDDPEPKAPEKPAPTDKKVADIWADASPEQRAELDRLKKYADRDKRLRGQVSASEREKAALRKKLAELQGQDDDDEEVNRIKEDYPEVAGPILKRQDRLKEQVKIQTDIDALEAKDDADRHAEHVDQERARIAEDHPDWVSVLKANSKAWLTWVDDQPKHIRDAVAQNDAEITDGDALSEVMTRFKAFLSSPEPSTPGGKPSTDPMSPKRRSQLAGARDIPQRSTRQTTVDPDENLDDDALFNKIMAAKARKRREQEAR